MITPELECDNLDDTLSKILQSKVTYYIYYIINYFSVSLASTGTKLASASNI